MDFRHSSIGRAEVHGLDKMPCHSAIYSFEEEGQLHGGIERVERACASLEGERNPVVSVPTRGKRKQVLRLDSSSLNIRRQVQPKSMALTNYHVTRLERGSVKNKIPKDPLAEWEVERVIDPREVNGH